MALHLWSPNVNDMEYICPTHGQHSKDIVRVCHATLKQRVIWVVHSYLPFKANLSYPLQHFKIICQSFDIGLEIYTYHTYLAHMYITN